ncbi:ribosome small subunit-dependent GTPase A [Litoreibacter roseus]|uniref:Small ribosomal subunit biogenesis GTPase RsgA n=1 Tax=Litoreibacter roseus TaxID=2601869 RepID=A0A6N6JN12_9RHOB|nr:ribosome small subunit-dependent GTPase A [Litoreibacter roseus]GFE66652.1 putative ribosome biogenesis GTPase RsgA [Litoreibacter roseus]
MTNTPLTDLGWSDTFASHVTSEINETVQPGRLSDVHRDRVLAKTAEGDASLTLPAGMTTGDLAVGDWVLADLATGQVKTLVPRRNVVRRKAAGNDMRAQLIAANVDTLMIVTSCNADFNPARLERYLALAASSDALPLVVLTKADLADDAASYRREVERLSPLATALTIDARDMSELATLAPWLRPGDTAALVGSSGVGKSTILNGLTGATALTQGIREDDAKGRHTTTSRSLRQTTCGGWLIDTPGMRSLPLDNSADGIAQVFADFDGLTDQCKFSDCQHLTEPGCAIQAAVAAGDLDEKRFHRWQKLQREDQYNSETIAEARARHKNFGKRVKSAMKEKRDKP